MAGGTATIAASAATLSDRGTGPQSSANPSGVRRIERTVTPVRTVKRPDAASAIGSRPTPPVIAANAEPAAESLAPSPVAARSGGDERAAVTQLRRKRRQCSPQRDPVGSPGIHASKQWLDEPIDDFVSEPVPNQLTDADVTS